METRLDYTTHESLDSQSVIAKTDSDSNIQQVSNITSLLVTGHLDNTQHQQHYRQQQAQISQSISGTQSELTVIEMMNTQATYTIQDIEEVISQAQQRQEAWRQGKYFGTLLKQAAAWVHLPPSHWAVPHGNGVKTEQFGQ